MKSGMGKTKELDDRQEVNYKEYDKVKKEENTDKDHAIKVEEGSRGG